MSTAITISRAAQRAGVGVETIRFYERRGLIAQPPRPRTGGYRLYDDTVVERIRFIRQAQELGFSLREIADLLALRADPAADCSNVRLQAIAKRDDVNRKIAQLQHIRGALDGLIASCPGGGALRACTILDAMSVAEPADVKRVRKTRASSESDHERQTRPSKGAAMKTVTIKIDGMHCEGCARTVTALVKAEPGVRTAAVSFRAGEAKILFDPAANSEDRLAARIEQAGYSVTKRS